MHYQQPTVSDDHATAQPRPSSLGFLTRAIVVLAIMLAARTFIPDFVEEIQYSLTRGQQRAEYELATERLPTSPLHEMSQASQLVSQRVLPSVVHLQVGVQTDAAAARATSNSPESSTKVLESGQGSGVILHKDGFVLTNFHVVQNADYIQATLSDGRICTAEVVGVDRLTDLAVLKISANRLIAAEWGDSDSIEQGAFVWAVGSPFGFQRSITSGIISAKNRGDRAGTVYQNLLQTDVAINQGNSGGPLVDARGKVVGINTMIVGGKTFKGVSLAIPSSVARGVYEQLRNGRLVARGWLGIRVGSVTPETAHLLHLENTDGARITSLVSTAGVASPARLAGLKQGDIIVRWGDRAITSTSELTQAIAATANGTLVPLVLIRDGLEMPLSITVGSRPSEFE